jgi:tetratricopeptide (TPR) repeat protein
MAAAAFGGDTPFTEHGDVLTADPQDAQGKAALVEELKSRARGAFAAKNYPVAERLYSKGLQVLPDAALYANRSAVRAGLGRHEAALDDAESALKTDPAYVKVLLYADVLSSSRCTHVMHVSALHHRRLLLLTATHCDDFFVTV